MHCHVKHFQNSPKKKTPHYLATKMIIPCIQFQSFLCTNFLSYLLWVDFFLLFTSLRRKVSFIKICALLWLLHILLWAESIKLGVFCFCIGKFLSGRYVLYFFRGPPIDFLCRSAIKVYAKAENAFCDIFFTGLLWLYYFHER